jgi:cyclopropane-fatty-acyl-phospholipid synthase
MLLSAMLNRRIRVGRLVVIDPAGRAHRFGPGGEPEVVVRLHDRASAWRIAAHPRLATGEAYMAGTLTIEQGTLRDFLHLCTYGADEDQASPAAAFGRMFARPLHLLYQHNPISWARSNVAHHYDLSRRLYDLFLDRDRQYSCAYFPAGSEGLDEAQRRKKLHIAAKLLLEPGMQVLDIGSGWGGLALEMARLAPVEVTGITLSREQLKAARERASAEGVADRVRFHLRDYREEHGTYDRVVSVGMFEHVGVPHYLTFFRALRRMLKPRGVALVHAIGRMGPPGRPDPWLRKYIFPGGYSPALSEVLAAVEKTGLWVTDIEILRLHYAQTLRRWFDRFQARREEARALYDERFCRMWEFYLTGCEMAFRNGRMMVFQIQLARERDAVPLTRDYIADQERRLAVASSLERRPQGSGRVVRLQRQVCGRVQVMA